MQIYRYGHDDHHGYGHDDHDHHHYRSYDDHGGKFLDGRNNLQNLIHGTKQQHGGPYVKNQGQWWTQNWSQQQRPQKYQFLNVDHSDY